MGTIWGPRWLPKWARTGAQNRAEFWSDFGASQEGPGPEATHPRGANALVFGPGGRLQRGVPRLRTSEFWIPDLGDLEAMDLDTLEYYNLVAKSLPLNSLVAP